MVGVFLVEDEYVVREGVKKSIDWKGHGMEMLGEANDGEIAFPQICKSKPDIVITDIKMPFMDGLELARLVKNEFPNIKIIILSGYGEFNYAKTAIELGVTDYLLKPITPDKLLEAVMKVAELVQKDRNSKANFIKFQNEMKENEDLARSSFFNDLISYKMNFEEIMLNAKKRKLDFSYSYYKVVLYSVTSVSTTNEITEYQNNIVYYHEKLLALVSKFINIDIFVRGVEGYAFLVKGKNEEEIAETTRGFIDIIIDLTKEDGALCYFGAVGSVVQRVKEIGESFMEARRVFSYRYLGWKNRIINYNETIDTVLQENKIPDIRSINLEKMDRDTVKNFLRNGIASETENFMKEYLNLLGDENLNSLMLRQYISMDVYISTATFLSKLGYDDQILSEKIGDVRNLYAQINTVHQMKEYLSLFLKHAIELRDTNAKKKYGKMIDDACIYIEAHYMEENISLNSVAESVNISPNYFSTIFSQETKFTFIEYLTKIRMNKACELLRCTDKKSSEIAYAIGYRDAHYFSYLFHKLEGFSPREYRENI